MEIYDGNLDIDNIMQNWIKQNQSLNFGAYASFVGVVRDEDGISGLSFDLHLPLLKSWFSLWQKRANEAGAIIKMAHSKGDVALHKSSFMAMVISPKRRIALEMLDDFVEDFKANAPIWKYDLIKNERIYAKNRSKPLLGAGILGGKHDI